MSDIQKINVAYPLFDRYSNFDTEELTTLELAGRTTQKVNEIIDVVNTGVASINGKENSDDITNKRKLSPTGNFTGSLMGVPVRTVLDNINTNTEKIVYLASQFADGQTGLVIDGGFFENSGIDKNYDGGVF